MLKGVFFPRSCVEKEEWEKEDEKKMKTKSVKETEGAEDNIAKLRSVLHLQKLLLLLQTQNAALSDSKISRTRSTCCCSRSPRGFGS